MNVVSVSILAVGCSIWVLLLAYPLAAVLWLRHIGPKWRKWFVDVRALLNSGAQLNPLDLAEMNQQITADLKERSPLAMMRRWNATYPLPRSRTLFVAAQPPEEWRPN